MGIVGRITELLVDSGFELLGEDVLEAIGLRVDGVDREAERFGEVLLEEAMVADDLERDLRPGVAELDATIGRVLGETERGQLLDHRRGGRRGYAHAPRNGRRRRALAGRLDLVDLLQIVLDGNRKLRFRHVSILA